MRSDRGTNLVGRIAMVLVALAFVAPFAWMLLASLRSPEEVARGEVFTLAAPRLSNYGEVFARMDVTRQLANTGWIALCNVIGSVISGALVGYAFARLRFRGRDLLFLVLLAAMLLPPQLTMIPQFLLFRGLGWLDTSLPLTVPAFLCGNGFNAFFVFLFRQYYLGLPRELEEAARVDGAGFVTTFTRIFLPLALPAAATVGVFAFVWTWNDFQLPLVFLQSQEQHTLALGLAAFKGGPYGNSQVNLLMAASVIAIAPCIFLFLAAQRLFLSSITVGGLKT
ncbi:MAG: carbohydrate ABC transporter permease [Planctomycetota bacterium]